MPAEGLWHLLACFGSWLYPKIPVLTSTSSRLPSPVSRLIIQSREEAAVMHDVGFQVAVLPYTWDKAKRKHIHFVE